MYVSQMAIYIVSFSVTPQPPTPPLFYARPLFLALPLALPEPPPAKSAAQIFEINTPACSGESPGACRSPPRALRTALDHRA